MANTALLKKQIREKMRYQRTRLTLAQRTAFDTAIIEQLQAHPILTNGRKVAGYYAMAGEINLKSWFQQAWQYSICCYLPVVVDKQLLFATYTKDTHLTPNHWGTPEPVALQLILPSQLEVMIVPLVAFDTYNNRLGRGGGYYDRSLAFKKTNAVQKKPYLIGVAYSFQKVPNLITNSWDVPMDTIITEQKN